MVLHKVCLNQKGTPNIVLQNKTKWIYLLHLCMNIYANSCISLFAGCHAVTLQLKLPQQDLLRMENLILPLDRREGRKPRGVQTPTWDLCRDLCLEAPRG